VIFIELEPLVLAVVLSARFTR